MIEIKITETCKVCDEPLTLMESGTIRKGNYESWLVKRCLTNACGGHPAEEVIQMLIPSEQPLNT